MYWTFDAQGASFGTFVNRNHFAFYMNICVGLTIGLLASRLDWRKRTSLIYRDGVNLRDAPSLAIVVSLIFMCVAVIMCSSRGGLISLLTASACVAVVAAMRKKEEMVSLPLLAAGVSATMALLAWLGFSFAASRYASLWAWDIPSAGRLDIWKQLLPLVTRLGLFGSGLGTLPYIEPISRTVEDPADPIWGHAHNEFVHVVVETGLLGLGCVLVFVLVTLRTGFRLASARGYRHARHCYGLLFVIVAVTVHSFFEFGLQMPAIAILAAVVAGQVFGCDRDRELNAARQRTRKRAGEADHVTDTKHNLKPASSLSALGTRISAAIVMVAVTTTALASARQSDLADRSRIAALRARAAGDLSTERHHFEAAARIAPSNAQFCFEVAQLRFGATVTEGSHDNVAYAAAQRSLVTSRDLCPLLAEAHVLLGNQSETFVRADTKSDYFQRARIIRPADATLAYVAGVERLDAGDRASALQHLRQSLSLSGEHLIDILSITVTDLSQAESVEQLLPDNANTLARTADWLDQRDVSFREISRRLRERALKSLQNASAANSAETHHLRAVLFTELDEFEQAQLEYLAALRRAPANVAWRVELAALLIEIDDLRAATDQVRRILRQHPSDPTAKEMQKEIARRSSNK